LARLYWINTAGPSPEHLLRAFVFLPMLGLRQTLGIAVALNVLAGRSHSGYREANPRGAGKFTASSKK